MISPQTIEQITNRIDIIDVVSEFVKLKKRGANYLGLCPFHNEKTPSFTVSPSKEIYKCFGCGKSGNTITFLMEHEKYSYAEALRWLAQRYNIEIEETVVSDEVKQTQQVAESLHAVNNFAQKFFSEQLFNTEEGESHALSYLDERGFKKDIIQKFQLGYSPQQRDAFTSAAIKQQFNKEILLKSGLVVTRNPASSADRDELADNYRGRIIFPIHNTTGKIIGFGARVIGSADKGPKYINTPENEIYVKSKILYGSYFARHAIDKNNECLLVEGYTDVISLHQAGIENVVASGGTSLTADQLRIIKKYTGNLTIIYDGDAAGVKAAMRGLDMALEEGLNVKLVLIPDKEDPDSYVNKVGTERFKKFVAENKKDFILFQLDILLKEAGNDISKKNDAVNVIAESLSKLNGVKDLVKKQEYIKRCADILGYKEEDLLELVNAITKEKLAEKGKGFPVDEGKIFNAAAQNSNEEKLNSAIHSLLDCNFQEREVVKRLIEYGYLEWDEFQSNADIILNTFDDFPMADERLIRVVNIYKSLLIQYNGLVNQKYLLYGEDEELNKFIAGLLYFPYELNDWSKKMEFLKTKLDSDIHRVVESALQYYKLRKIKVMYAEVEEILERQTDEQIRNKNMRAFIELKKIERGITDKIEIVYIK